jgi:hypothetical protein
MPSIPPGVTAVTTLIEAYAHAYANELIPILDAYPLGGLLFIGLIAVMRKTQT